MRNRSPNVVVPIPALRKFDIEDYRTLFQIVYFGLYLVIHSYTCVTMQTLDQVRELFEINGESIAQWARQRGFSPALVYRVLRGETTAVRGKTHEIAIALGVKRAPTEDERQLFLNSVLPQHPERQPEEKQM